MMPNLHIGLVIYGSLDTLSGGYLYDRKLVSFLQSQGHKVEIVSLPWRNYVAHLGDNFSGALLQRLKDAPFDVLLQDELNHPSLAWLNGRLRPHISYPILSIVHHLRSSEKHPALRLPFYRAVERHYLASVDGFIFNSHTTKTVVHEMVGKKRPFVVAPPAGDRFTPLPEAEIIAKHQQDGPLRLLFVGNVTARKGLHTLIEAVRTLPTNAWTLDVVGNTAVEPAYAQKWLHEKPTALSIANNITIHGALSDDDLEKQFAQSDLLVVPSQYEGFGIVYLEGMGFGLPAIGTTSGAAHESIKDGENGFLIGAGETAVLQNHLLTLINNRQQLHEMSLSALARFHTHPTWEATLAKIEQFVVHF